MSCQKFPWWSPMLGLLCLELQRRGRGPDGVSQEVSYTLIISDTVWRIALNSVPCLMQIRTVRYLCILFEMQPMHRPGSQSPISGWPDSPRSPRTAFPWWTIVHISWYPAPQLGKWIRHIVQYNTLFSNQCKGMIEAGSAMKSMEHTSSLLQHRARTRPSPSQNETNIEEERWEKMRLIWRKPITR